MQNESRGYLHEDFRLFHLKDSLTRSVEPHYHEFDKIVFFLSGQLTYTVEGRTYQPGSGDVIFVGAGDIHSLTVDSSEDYERVVFWVSPAFLRQHSDGSCDLRRCFTHQEGQRLLRLTSAQEAKMTRLVAELERELKEPDIGSDLMSSLRFLQLMLELQRAVSSGTGQNPGRDDKVDEIMGYITNNLREDLSIEAIAGRFYLSRYYLMHRFKEITGCTVHDYVRQKRLAAAARALTAGKKPSEAAEISGFADYSAFLRAFKGLYGVSPRQYSSLGIWNFTGTAE